ncbi:MAG TPA: hypothetical protein VHK47_18105 [Polyangia bacterium]|jgi:hypothetical protein|nr:hypothetical protein [Polyangia bacterium]
MTGAPRRAVGRAKSVVLGAALALGCARAASGPAATLSALGGALERKDYDAAYAMTSADFRARVPREAFRAELEEAGAEAQGLARRLRGAGEAARPRVTVDLAPGEPVSLVEEGGRWVVDDPTLFEPWSQRTPRAALRSFVRALEQRRYDVVLRLCPTQRRPTLSVDALRAYWEGDHKGENAALLTRLRAALDAPVAPPIVEIGDEARMPYGGGGEVRLVREDGAWKIENPD